MSQNCPTCSARSTDVEMPDEMRDLSTTVVHDIKNSVLALSMLLRNARGSLSDPEFQQDAIATLSSTVDRLERLLHTLASPCATSTPSAHELIDLRELIVEATRPLASVRRVRMVRDLSSASVVYGDRDGLRRVIENLTTNAVESIADEGTVTVALIEIDGHALISVTDTGCGIPREYRDHHLFSPLRSTKKGGWGVGLYQVKQVVENCCGEILVDSAVGRGTTFTVKLPLQLGSEPSCLESVR